MTNPNSTRDLLIEIGCEDLPPKYLKKIQDSFTEAFTKLLLTEELKFKSIQAFSTPRRIAIRVIELAIHQPTRLIIKKGPAKNAAFDEKGHFTKAALGFAESCGVPVETLSLQETDKGAWLVFQQETPPQSSEQLISRLLPELLNHFSAGKRMRWGDAQYTFPRPIHWILFLFGNKKIETELYGLKTGNVTYGHRFHHPEAIPISTPLEYEEVLLKKGFVIADFNKRRDHIQSQLNQVAKTQGYHAVIDEDLLDEVTGLVEWPVVLVGSFEKSFLEIPKEALISSMKTHQKCFPIVDQNQSLLPKFLIVSNIESKSPASVIAGNEWVMKARLADAAFYYQEDKKITLEKRREGLKQVRFHQGLGSLWDKSERVAKLAHKINAHSDTIERAALLCKVDLLTQMVGEFPELQGIMGYYYALQDKEPESVALAIADHYYPRFAEDTLPRFKEGCVIALADRIDSLIGLFGLGNHPTGDKDPFALRRQALGLLRILIEREFDLDLKTLLENSKEIYKSHHIPLPNTNVVLEVLEFCFERFRAWYQVQNISTQVFEAVFAKNLTNPLDFHKRIQAVNAFTELKEAESLAAANKRVKNILSKSDVFVPKDSNVENALLKEEAEKMLWSQLSNQEKAIEPLLQTRNYEETLKRLATLRDPIDYFFTEVMVMVEDEKLRHNRLRLLNRLRTLFLKIADISLL